MKRRLKGLIALAVAVFFLAIATPQASSQSPQLEAKLTSPAPVAQFFDLLEEPASEPTDPPRSEAPDQQGDDRRGETTAPEPVNPTIVILGDRPIFEVKTADGSRSAAQRAAEISDRLTTLANDPFIPLESIQVGDQGNITVIFSGDVVLARITEADAIAASTTTVELANQYAASIGNAIANYRQANELGTLPPQTGSGWESIPQIFRLISNRNVNIGTSRAILYAAIATFILAICLFVLGSLFRLIFRRIEHQRDRQINGIRIRDIEFFSADQLIDFTLDVTKFIRFVINLGVFTVYLVFVFSLFPVTKRLEEQFWQYLLLALNNGWEAFVDYIPNMFSIFLISSVIYYILKFIRPIFRRLGDGSLTIAGFYPEFAQPTYRIIELLVLALTAIVIFPYLPGFGSPAFRAIALFLGALVSFGSTTAVANGVAGIILIYTRSFQIGDRIKIGNVIGNVEEKMLLVTRIRTFENTVVTIPNANLLSDNIINYSATIRDSNTPVMLSTIITIGYDVPWRQLEPVLVDAALATAHVLTEPAPFVLQLGLGDFSVSYELKVYTDRPTIMELIHSELHRNIQDKCNEAEIEILSPVYSAVRDGNQSTIPADYLPDEYATPGFNLHPLGNLFQIDLRMGKDRNGRPVDPPQR
jgi:small-conductance mechanosensitive channel